MLLATFWGPKALHFLMRFLKSFLGAETDRRVSDGTSAGLRRDFGGTSTQLFPRRIPPRRRPLRARRNPITTARNAKHEIQHALGQRPGELLLLFIISF